MRRALLACVGAAGAAVVTAGVTGGAAFGATSGAQSFTITNSGRHGPPHVNATGPIHGSGYDRQVSQNHDRFIFPGQGSVGVNHATTASHPGPSVGCTFFYNERGTYQLTGGTGQYVGASGGGTYTLQDVFFANRKANGECSQHSGQNLTLINAHGHTTLPRG